MAQNETDALRYSQLQFGGTARIQGMAGAQTALGGDISTLNGNPAGIGFYRRNDLSFSTGLNFGSSTTTFSGTSTQDSKGNFNVPSFGLVLTSYKGDTYEGDWKSYSFGFSFTRQGHYHNRFSYSGINNTSSITQMIAQTGRSEASLIDEATNDEFYSLEGMAYQAYLINPRTTGGGFESVYPVDPTTGQLMGSVRQQEEIVGKGALNQWDITFGGNYRDKLFLGGSLGIVGLSYRQERTFTEFNETVDSPLREVRIKDQFKTNGNGINLKLGAIFKPADWVNIGATIQTPTLNNLNDSYSSSLASDFRYPYSNPATPGDSAVSFAFNTIPGTYDYSLTTPFRASGGVAVFAGKSGFVSADVEYVNYSQARFNANSDSQFPITNSYISNLYQSAVNLRVGAEYRYEIFRLRAGYANYGDPFANSSTDRSRSSYTAGAGIRQDNFYFDLAFVHSEYNTVYQPYTLETRSVPAAITNNKYNNFVATVGVTF